jgi:hypothetical protein
LQAYIQKGKSPFLTWVQVEEGIFYWNAEKARYIDANQRNAKQGNSGSNWVSKIMLTIGVCIIFFGIIGSLLVGDELWLLYAIGSFVSGMVFVAIAEIIKLLQIIANQKRKAKSVEKQE